MHRIYIAISDYDSKAIDMLYKYNVDITIREPGPRPDEKELIELVQNFDVLIIGAKEKMSDIVYRNANQLKIIGTLSIGLDHISNKFINDKNIKVINCPNSNVSSTAEHTFALILALSKKLLVSHEATCSLKGRDGLGGFPNDLYGKTIGVIGCGRIGKYVINLAKAFNMNILCHTLHPEKHQDILSDYKQIQFTSLKDLLPNSDIVSIHVPLMPETKNLLNKDHLKLIKKTSFIINTSRSVITNNAYISYLLKNNLIKGFALDIDIEEEKTIRELCKYQNVILTPHTAGVSIDSMIRMDTELASQLTKILRN